MTLPSVLLLIAPLSEPLPPNTWPSLAQAEWDSYSYEMLEDEGWGDYVLTGEVRARGGKPTGRVLLNLLDESNYYAAELGSRGTRLLRIESGLELPIGEGSELGVQGKKWREVTIRREGTRIEVFLDGRRVASAADDTFPGGRIAFGSRNGSLEFRDLFEQDMAPVYLEDDFMRADGETGGWELVKGDWRVQSVGSPVRSNNAFNFAIDSAPKGATAVCGDWFWHDYQVSVSCQPHGDGQAGVYAYYVDPKNHYLFACGRLNSRTESVAELISVRRGKRQVLDRQPVPFAPHQWCGLSLRVEGDRLTGSIDGHRVVAARTDVSPGGRAGLCSRGADGVTFDDFVVRQNDAVTCGGPQLALWRSVGGRWEGVEPGMGDDEPAIRGVASSTAKLLFNERMTGDAWVSTQAACPEGTEVGLIAAWEDDRNYHALTYGGAPPVARLSAIVDGETTVQAKAPASAPNGPVRLELVIDGQAVIGRATGADELIASNGLLPRGRVGLLVRDGEATFSSPTVRRARPLPEVAHFEGTFTQEISMADWAAENSDWATVDAQDGDPGPSYWHKAPAYGDSALSVRPTSPPAGPVSIMVAAPEVGSTEGYRLTVTPGANGSAVILRNGQQVASQQLGELAAQALGEVGLRKRGPLLVGSVNRQSTVVFHDPEPLPGLFAGWVAPSESAAPADATWRAENVLSYSFRRAPSDWWIGSGHWRITNRWDCEPRWTFFIGGGEGVACLWNKREFGGDVTLDFYGAIRFDSTKGYQYPHAANINCTIGADGRDLSSGYSLMFGGWDNQYTRLLRGNEVVAESTEHVIPRSGSIHRRWFNLRISKAGGRIRCWLDGAQLFDYTDPDPLLGRRIALWTYDNAIALARVRIASDGVSMGPLAAPEGPPKCPYDAPTPGAANG